MREHLEHDEHKQPSASETILGLFILFALATAIWFFVEGPKKYLGEYFGRGRPFRQYGKTGGKTARGVEG